MFARVLSSRNMRSFVKKKPCEMAKSLRRLLIKVNHVLVANFIVANMYFNAIRENKILAKISEFTVHVISSSIS